MKDNIRIVFMGTPDFSVPCLRALADAGSEPVLVVTQPDKPKGRGYISSPPPVKIVADDMNIAVLQPDSVKTEDFADKLIETEPDIIVTVAYGKILPVNVLNISRIGCINVHASVLPLLRGANPIASSLIQGFSVTGTTTMIMDEGMDTGDILLSSEVAITADMNFEELHNILAHNAAELLLKTLEHIKGVRSISELRSLAVPQDSSKATYAPVMRRKDAKIDWSKSSEEIHNLVRGTYDWPVAWCITDKGNMKVWKTKLTHEYYQEKMTPGSIIKSDDDGLHVACESGIIVIEELQFESQKRMKSVEYIRGHSSIEGWVLK